MIRAVGEHGGLPLLLIGFTRTNLNDLREGRPFFVATGPLGLPPMHVAIVGGVAASDIAGWIEHYVADPDNPRYGMDVETAAVRENQVASVLDLWERAKTAETPSAARALRAVGDEWGRRIGLAPVQDMDSDRTDGGGPDMQQRGGAS